MSNRKLLLLSGVFLALLAFVILFERHQPTSEQAAKARKKLLDFKAEDVTSVLVERSDLPPVTLEKVSSRWRIAGDGGGPADAVSADALVSDLARLEVVGEVRTDFDPKEFGLDAPKAKATIALTGVAKRTVLFGKEVPGTDATAAAEGGRFGAVKFAPMAALVKPLDEYRSKALLEVPSSEITRITVVKGPNKVVVAREGGTEKEKASEWRIEAPVKDLASRTFVEQLLSDFASARVSEFPSVPAADLPKVGLLPPGAVVTLQKGAEVVSNVAFGAAKAEAAGKLFARRDNLVVVVDDRVQENLNKEFTAYREPKICPVDSWALAKVSFESEGRIAGAEKVEGSWRSGGRPIASSLAEDLADKVGRAEAKGFVAPKDYAAHGIPVAKGKAKPPAPVATLEATEEKGAPKTVRFFPAAPLGTAAVVAAEVTGRSEAVLVERSVLDDLKALAEKIRSAATGTPSPAPKKASPAKGSAAPAPNGRPPAPVAAPAPTPAR